MTRDDAGAAAFASRVGWLSRMAEPLRTALLGVARLKRCAPLERLYAVGGEPGGLYGLVEGCLAIEAAQSELAPHKGFLVHPGVWIGEGPVAGLEWRLTGAWATRPSTVLHVEIAAFRRLAAQEPELWRHLALLALENHGRTIGLAQDLMRRGSRDRFLAVLARLAGLREAFPPAPAAVDATQGEMAAIANLSRGVVSTLLLEMEHEGLVRLRRAGVEIVDAPRLLAACEAEGAVAPA